MAVWFDVGASVGEGGCKAGKMMAWKGLMKSKKRLHSAFSQSAHEEAREEDPPCQSVKASWIWGRARAYWEQERRGRK